MLYLLTISCQQKEKYVRVQDIEEVIKWLPCKVKVSSFETSGKYRQLHYHAIVKHKGYYKAYTQYGDSTSDLSFKVQWTTIHDLKGATSYVLKDTRGNPIIQDQIIDDNIIQHEYLFD